MTTESNEAKIIANSLGLDYIDDDPLHSLGLMTHHRDVLHRNEVFKRPDLGGEKPDENTILQFERDHSAQPPHHYKDREMPSLTD